MRVWLLATVLALVVAAVPAPAQNPSAPVPYDIKIDKDRDGRDMIHVRPSHEGKKGVWVTIQFRVLKRSDGSAATDIGGSEIIVEEDGVEVAKVPIKPRATEDLTATLAMDISGSMAAHDKIGAAKRAANTFFDKLHDRANCGLILFDHEVRVNEPPTRDPSAVRGHRDQLREHINGAKPMGGTAYLDATAKALEQLEDFRGRKVAVVMTDGQDVNSKYTLDQVIEKAQIAEVPVYTLGVGTPGKNEQVTVVLVLDKSLSMNGKADVKDNLKKIDALKEAASRFVELMRANSKTSLLTFGDKPDQAQAFSSDKKVLKRNIQAIEPKGQTAFFDATYDGVLTLEAARPPGRRVVIAMTDGKDNRSHRRVEEVIMAAKTAKVPLYILGLGKAKEIDEEVMKRMARDTDGKYYHASNQQELIEFFEALSIEINDDGIDEASLTRLAKETGGKYLPVRDVSQLDLIYAELADELQNSYTLTYPSRRSEHDGTARDLKIRLMRDGVVLGDVTTVVQVPGVMVPVLKPAVYLTLLVMLCGLLAIPPGIRRLYNLYGGQ